MTICGLSVSLAGSLMLSINAFYNIPGLWKKGTMQEITQRRFFVSLGMMVLSVGFLLQLLAVVIPK